jgi:imidazolonepropionase-like amidohydrolase
MSDATMDLMIKTIRTIYLRFLQEFCCRKSPTPNYYPAIVVPKALAIGPKIAATLLDKKGVPIGFGTDAAVFPSWGRTERVCLYERGGMPAIKTIQAATIVNKLFYKWRIQLSARIIMLIYCDKMRIQQRIYAT